MADIDALVVNLRDLASPEAECLPDGYRLSCLIRQARIAADALEAERSARVRLEGALRAVRANLVRLAWEENSLMIEGIDAALSHSSSKGESRE